MQYLARRLVLAGFSYHGKVAQSNSETMHIAFIVLVFKRINFHVRTQQCPYRNDRNHEKQCVVLLELNEDTYKCPYEKVRT